MTQTDPVCGMPIAEDGAIALEIEGVRCYFCSDFCQQEFLRHPGAYATERQRHVRTTNWTDRRVAYFSMEVALSNDMPTYSGGLGVLAGDTLRSCADLEVPIVAVSLVHRRGYFQQEIRDDWQTERDATWEPERLLHEEPSRVAVDLEGRRVVVRAWRYDVVGTTEFVVPVLLLDTDVPENAADDRRITDRLYGGDERYRLLQEAVLGIGGVRLLRALGCADIRTLHLNEGHAALAPLELLRAQPAADTPNFRAVKERTVFTTHTPVAAGHDQFDRALVSRVLGEFVPSSVLDMLGGRERLDMTRLALNSSHYVNGVAQRHREVSRELFPLYDIQQITNGVHPRTWTCKPFRTLFDRHVTGWRGDPVMLRNALSLSTEDVRTAHRVAKDILLEAVLQRTGRLLRPDVLTIGFARRATAYKRAELVLSDLSALRTIAKQRPLQFVFAGKAHPRDEPGKQGIHSILRASRELGDEIPVVYLADYDLDLALSLVSGADLWLNTPLRPLEASGTSGMKAALNGVPSLSVLDGWWREGCVEGATGWAIGDLETTADGTSDATDLYRKLQHDIAPLFYDDREGWARVMRQCIALNGSFFNTHRMVGQYVLHAYSLDAAA